VLEGYDLLVFPVEEGGVREDGRCGTREFLRCMVGEAINDFRGPNL
jgi:hypothetical protein